MTVRFIPVERARQNLPNSANTDEPLIDAMIQGASRAIQRYCRRDFLQTDYDELYNGTGDRRLLLRQYPLLAVSSVRYRPVTVLKLQNSFANTPIARVQVTTAGLTLTRVTSGVTTTDTSILWATYPTVVSVQNAINALGGGWAAQGSGYDQYPSADIYCPNGLAATSPDAPLAATQGALTAAGQYAELKLHTYELAGYQLDPRRGWLLRAIPYTDPELLHPEDLIWPVGINNFRVQYTAGYATVPEDVQEACAELVATWFQQKGQNLGASRESTAGTYQIARWSNAQLPPAIRAALKPYKRHTSLSEAQS